MNHAERLKDIREYPANHKHRDMNGIMSCAMVDGAISIAIMQAHEGLHGHNGGVGCDVASGPCSCGSWHGG